jgi:hypothetical protein
LSNIGPGDFVIPFPNLEPFNFNENQTSNIDIVLEEYVNLEPDPTFNSYLFRNEGFEEFGIECAVTNAQPNSPESSVDSEITGSNWESSSSYTHVESGQSYPSPTKFEDIPIGPEPNNPEPSLTMSSGCSSDYHWSPGPSFPEPPSALPIPRSQPFICPHCSIPYADNSRLQ